MLKVTIDGRPIEVSEGTTILEACQFLGIDVPTLPSLAAEPGGFLPHVCGGSGGG